MIVARPSPRVTPIRLTRMDVRTRSRSPRVVPRARARFGLRSGAITMAAMITVALSRMRPIAATIAARATITRNCPVTPRPSVRSA